MSDSYFFGKEFYGFDWGRLEGVVRLAVRFLDDVGSKNTFPNQKFWKWYQDHRPIGLGIMGFADLCLKMGIEYGSGTSIDLLSDIQGFIYNTAKDESYILGKERGVPEKCKPFGRRNITVNTIAPTGSISFLAECSSSIEPIFSPVYQRTDERGEKYLFDHPMKNEGYFVSAINEDKGKIPTWKQHIDIQLAAQRFTDSGVSKTINFPNEATIDEVHEAFVYAWKNKAKGITVYRDGSRNVQVLEDVKIEDTIDCVNGVCEL